MSGLELLTPAVSVFSVVGLTVKFAPSTPCVSLRVASDELYVVCPLEYSAEIERDLGVSVRASGALLTPLHGEYEPRLLVGAGADGAFGALVSRRLDRRPCFYQGRIVCCRTKALVSEDAVLILLDAPSSHAFDGRCPRSWTTGSHGAARSHLQSLLRSIGPCELT